MDYIKRNSKNILIGLLVILLICASIIIFYLIKSKKNLQDKEIVGTVIIADKEYLMVESEKENYLITNIKGTYDIGDMVKFSYLESDINDKMSPKQIKINDEELISKKEVLDNNSANNNEIKDNEVTNNSNKTDNDVKPSNNSKPNNTNSNTNNNANVNSNNKNENADTIVLKYVNNLQKEANTSSIGDNVKKGFVTVIDFLFYNGTINGYTFNNLSNSAKLKILGVALYLDSKIEKYFPGYKESISTATNKIYTNAKNMIVTSYLNITTKICENNNELCKSAKDGFGELKKNFGLTFNLIKEIAGDGITNLKSWYEIWREN